MTTHHHLWSFILPLHTITVVVSVSLVSIWFTSCNVKSAHSLKWGRTLLSSIRQAEMCVEGIGGLTF